MKKEKKERETNHENAMKRKQYNMREKELFVAR
jgi:hypothetical protein